MVYEVDGIKFTLGERHGMRVVKFKQFLPAGVTALGASRDQDIVQFFTDPGGLRTVAVADIRLVRPSNSGQMTS